MELSNYRELQENTSESQRITCRNCTKTLQAEDAFCAKCGQRVIRERPTVPQLVYNFWVSLFSMDRGFFYTTKMMLRWPGYIVKDYLNGRTVCYYNPFKFMFLWIGLSELITLLNNKVHPTAKDTDPPPVDDIDRYFEKVYAILEAYPLLIPVLFLPILAWIGYRIFHRAPYNVAEHTITLAFIIGQVTSLETLLYLGYLAFPSVNVDSTLEDVSLFLILPVSVLCYHQLFDLSWWKATLNTVLLWLFGFIALIISYTVISLTVYFTLHSFGVTF